MQLITDYIVPCILCEDPLEHVTIFRTETGVETSTREKLPHDCSEMRSLRAERSR